MIRIGFAQEIYNFLEPEFTRNFRNVTLIKEDDRQSEQTFAVVVTVSNPASALRAATPEVTGQNPTISTDYRLTNSRTSTTFFFSPFSQSIAVPFFLNADDLPEGTEAFQASSTLLENSPNFQPPITNTAFQNTEIQILDDDCKLNLTALVYQ